MNNIRRNKTLLFIIVILLLTNVIMVVFFFNMTRKAPPSEEPRRISFTDRLKTQVGFSDEQIKAFEPRRNEFWKEMRQKFDSIRDTKKDFFYMVYDSSVPDSVIVERSKLIGEQQQRLDLLVVRYYKDIRTLCTSEQVPKFDSLLPPIIERMVRPGPGRK